MKTKALLLTLLTTAVLSVNAQEAMNPRVFIYSPNERAGLHIAQQTDNGWQEIGQLCSSDYGTWGVEKRMYHPSVCRVNDGTWRLVFQVNDRSPLFAAAYSKDLVNWRPQDYPILKAKGCLAPVVIGNPDNTCYIYYKTSGGQKRRITASADFRHFTDDRAWPVDDQLWEPDTATIRVASM